MSRSHRTITLSLALAAAAMSAPSAFAMRQIGPGPAGVAISSVRYAYDRPDRRMVPLTPPSQTTVTPLTATPTATRAGGYTVTDAWITAGAVLALILLALTGAAVLRGRTRREQRPAMVTH